MSVNFFKTACKESVQYDSLFGICDDQDGSKAYTNSLDIEKWIATVINDNNKEIAFTAIDNCIIILKEGTKDKESSCDGMLTFQDSIYLVELKRQRTGGWLPDAIGQLRNTIKLIATNHNLENITYKKAYACNRKHPNFTTIDNELSKRFFKETNGFRVDAQAKIVIK